MRLLLIAAISAAALCVAGCQRAEPGSPEEIVFVRMDCQKTVDNPALKAEWEQTVAICSGRATAAGTAAAATVPTGYGTGGAIASGIQAGITQGTVSNATGNACMAERGYLRKTRSESEAFCEAIREQKQAQVAAATPAPKQKGR